ncbi:hypothetical protein JHK87_001377 [Glycine soja]|nr:hypothetical protein JHK87_001377 [Glycine soja]
MTMMEDLHHLDLMLLLGRGGKRLVDCRRGGWRRDYQRVLKPSSVLKAQSFLREIEGNMEDVEEANRAAAESCH